LVSTVAVLMIVAIGSYGATQSIQTRVKREIESVFLDLRQTFGKAEYRQAELDIWNGRLTISDISVQSNVDPDLAIRIGQLVASNLGNSTEMLSAGHVDIVDVELVTSRSTEGTTTDKAPKVTFDGLSIPRSTLVASDASSGSDKARWILRAAAGISASAISIPEISEIVGLPGAGGDSRSAERAISNLQIANMRAGHIDSIAAGRVDIRGGAGIAGRPSSTSQIENASTKDADLNVFAAIVDEAGPKEETYSRLFRELSVGTYAASFADGGAIRIDMAKLEDLGAASSKFGLSQLRALAAAAPANNRSNSATGQLEKVALLTEGLQIARLELRGVSIKVPRQGDMKLAALRLRGVENGNIAEAALEGFSGGTPQDDFELGRLDVKSLRLANALRASARFYDSASSSVPERVAEILGLVEGVNIERFSAPDKKTGKQVRIEKLAGSWGRFVGQIPSTARVTAKIAIPTNAADPSFLGDLARAGFNTAGLQIDIEGAWDEEKQTFAVTPASLEMQGLFSATASLAASNVQRLVFVVDPAQFQSASGAVQISQVEFSVRDTGFVDLMVAQVARNQRLQPAAARQVVIGNSIKGLEAEARNNPEIQRLIEAIAQFIETPKETLTIKMAPKGAVTVAQILGEKTASPLARFKVDASVTQTGQPPTRSAALAWALVRDSSSQIELEEFAGRFAGSFFARLAQARIEQLKKTETAVLAPPTPPSSIAAQSQITVPDGLTTEQVFARLAGYNGLSGDLAGAAAEGSLLPGSYQFDPGLPRARIVERMRSAQEALLQEVWQRRSADLPLKSLDEVVILASIIEKETGKPEERIRIAAMLVNRLKQGMKLQSDPTVVYGLAPGKGSLGRPITRDDISLATPYNTYIVNGLPPGPIANPGRASIEAAANPAKTRDLYFVGDGSGGHLFAETYDQHIKNVARLREIERGGDRDPAAASDTRRP